MAIIKNGIVGGFLGKVGPVVGTKWKGLYVMRGLPDKSTKPPSEKQEAQQARFKLAINFVNKMRELLQVSFKDFNDNKMGTNSAASYVMKNAVIGEYPNLAIDYSYVLVARGDLPNVIIAAAASTEPGKISFTWTDNAGRGIAKKDDKAILVAYCEEKKLFYSKYKDGASRSDGLDELETKGLSGKTVQTWLSFISANKKDVAPSVYTGEVIVR